jgi:hypothetical protein
LDSAESVDRESTIFLLLQQQEEAAAAEEEQQTNNSPTKIRRSTRRGKEGSLSAIRR